MLFQSNTYTKIWIFFGGQLQLESEYQTLLMLFIATCVTSTAGFELGPFDSESTALPISHHIIPLLLNTRFYCSSRSAHLRSEIVSCIGANSYQVIF